MLALPRLDEASPRGLQGTLGSDRLPSTQGSPRPMGGRGGRFPLKSCLHFDDTSELQSVQTLMQKRLLGEAGGADSSDGAASSSPRRRKERRDMKALAPLSSTRSTQRFNGVEGISMSQAGSWLDSRCFREACEAAGASPRNVGMTNRRTPRRGELSEGEKFVLKRCKEWLMRRHGTVNAAFRRFDTNKSDGLTKTEFLEIFRKEDATILWRLMDGNNDQLVTLSELQAVLEEV
mmetsp:Transcript_131468/g.281089  ORF Transcript_131468/g.281089 Transcript_131468/m.281089 type:complete len:234 (+) Transcript_131468:37-738(+)